MAISTETRAICRGCYQQVAAETATVTCAQCGSIFHQDCWERHGECISASCMIAGVSGPCAHQSAAEAQTAPGHDGMAEGTVWGIVALAVSVLIVAGVVAVRLGAPLNTVLVVGVVIAALTFDYVNGMHDAGNAIATVISTRVLTPAAALVMAAMLNLVGALAFSGVAKGIAEKFADMGQVEALGLAITPMMILCGLVGASLWSFFTARIGLPVSTSHSLFGGLIGVFLLAGIPLNKAYLGTIFLFIVLAPLMAFTVGWMLMHAINFLVHTTAPYRINKVFRVLQVFSAAAMAFMHGSNDAQKAMGIITMALFSVGFVAKGPDGVDVPTWVKIACALMMALGTGFGGMRVIKTLGHKIIKLAPIHGFTAETVAAATIMLVTHLHIPISTTHVISSSILGIGASRRLSTVRWGVAGNIVAAWIFTIPSCALAGSGLYCLVRWMLRIA
ncbi:MAG TPA: inorganic phosphate transporter [Armatimonadota bacterium]|nr:inorganic phosphate transporter [Armatimonadota bacterium]